jgi:hypothetical protein
MIDFYYTQDPDLITDNKAQNNIFSNADNILKRRLFEFDMSTAWQTQFVIEHQHRPYYLQDKTPLTLICVFFLIKLNYKTHTYCAIAEKHDGFMQALKLFQPNNQRLVLDTELNNQPLWGLVKQFNAAFIPLDQSLLLDSINIEKPWGQECWLTGIEERGQSTIISPFSTTKTPLPWLLDLLPNYFEIDASTDPILLKILDPVPDDIYGDLYFEMHHVKQEVYVVTNVDKQAWPTGIAKMRFGFNQHKREAYNDEQAFKAAFSLAVKEYYLTRNTIDTLLDNLKVDNHFAVNTAVPISLSKQWLKKLPQELINDEQQLRAIVESFIGYMNVQQGDVIVIPKLTPHSLMHGVRCIEFQTPVYERQILFFAQKVLTQSHWDTDTALSYINCQQAKPENIAKSQKQNTTAVEVIVDFDQFEVVRYKLEANTEIDVFIKAPYCLLMNVCGELACLTAQFFTEPQFATKLKAEQACYMSRRLLPDNGLFKVINTQSCELIFLIAYPKTHSQLTDVTQQ